MRLMLVAASGVVAWTICLLLGASSAWSGLLALWVAILVYCVIDWRKRIYFLTFISVFFIFLMGRESLAELLDYRPSGLGADALAHLSLVLTVALGGALLGYVVGTSIMAPWRRGRATEIIDRYSIRARSVRYASSVVFWVTLPASYYLAGSRAIVALRSGYADLYGEEFRTSAATGLSAVFAQASLVNLVALSAYLTTLPKPFQARSILVGWMGYLLLSLASGQRAGFMIGTLFLGCYAVSRSRMVPDDGWMTTRSARMALLSLPGIVLLLALVESVRGVGSEYSGGFLRVITDFFYNQGVSSTVITNGYLYEYRIPVQQYLLEFMHSGIPARIFGIPVLQGNSVERALEGASYTHSLSYVVLGENLYLSGRGTGSSFVAEAFQVYGIFGVLAVAAMFGLLISWIETPSRGLIVGTIQLLIVRDIFLAPRGSSSGFLVTLLAPSTYIGLGLIAFGAFLYYRKKENGDLVAPEGHGGGRGHDVNHRMKLRGGRRAGRD